MDLSVGLVFGALPVLLLGASVGLSHAYNRLSLRHARSERDRDSYLEVLEGSNDALFVINFVNGRIYQANEQAAALLGYTKIELAARTIFDLHPPEHLHLSAQRIAEAWESKGLVYEDIPLRTARGELIAVECSTRVTTYRGDPAIILFARDIRTRLELQRRVADQQALVRQQNTELLSSIRYAQRIQRAVLPEAEDLTRLFPDSFVMFRPRDIVSGDLYWFAQQDGRYIVTAADCTGHGVPGALLSLIGASLFHEMVVEKRMTDPGAILDGARDGMVQALSKHDGAGDHRDGMNACLVSIDMESLMLDHAGAFGPLYLVRGQELVEVKGDRMPIGFEEGEMRNFTTTRVPLMRGDRIFLFSDGLADQFGGERGKKLKASGLKQWLIETSALPIDDVYQAMSDRFRSWKGEMDQVDDVLLIGIQI
ncbi:MAG: SpoIIE family protein phosphatase [Flavobacteriales bacterium]|nr:SpoIIE family protein phosphatase [Flavobacteriales bacterium]